MPPTLNSFKVLRLKKSTRRLLKWINIDGLVKRHCKSLNAFSFNGDGIIKSVLATIHLHLFLIGALTLMLSNQFIRVF